ncbi:hypothetical protein WAI453_011560 [Rhynchosporium graminicola]
MVHNVDLRSTLSLIYTTSKTVHSRQFSVHSEQFSSFLRESENSYNKSGGDFGWYQDQSPLMSALSNLDRRRNGGTIPEDTSFAAYIRWRRGTSKPTKCSSLERGIRDKGTGNMTLRNCDT